MHLNRLKANTLLLVCRSLMTAAIGALFGWMLLSTLVSQVMAADVKASVIYVTRDEVPVIPLSLLDLPAKEQGLLGAQLGLNDNQTTGDFLGHLYDLVEIHVGKEDNVAAAVTAVIGDVPSIIMADLLADDLLEVATALPSSLLINIRAKDDRLRNDDCRANVLHVAPSRTMLSDGLIQYFVWKRWDELVLVVGRHEGDKQFGEALKGSVRRYGLTLVEEKSWTSVPGARRTDSGHHNLQQEVPTFARFKNHDVVLIADEADEFGEYFAYRTAEPRPVAGTQGLMPSIWHRSQEQWGATQIQRRFLKLAGRYMLPRDYSAWAAMRSIGEAVTQIANSSPEGIRRFLLSDKFTLAGFKGVPLTYRSWNGQLRQPILVVGPRMLVSVSPQDGFLHQVSMLDTLGFDEPQSSCLQFR